MRISLWFATILLCGVAAASADEQTRQVQDALKGEGFYYGSVDGNPGPETTAAIRRYQIRNGLEVTGTLTAETLSSLKLGNRSTARATQGPQPATPKRPAFTADDESADREADNDRRFLQRNPSPVPGRAPLQSEETIRAPEDYHGIFAGTPYEVAPLEVQRDTLLRAQRFLDDNGYYDGALDGIPGPGTEGAIEDFQDDERLRITGRLDLDTLREMNLMPQRRVIRRDRVMPPPTRWRGRVHYY